MNPSPMLVARNRATRLAAPVANTRLAYSTTTGVLPAGPSERDRRNAQAAMDELRAILARYPDERRGCCLECDMGSGPEMERYEALHAICSDYEAACRRAGLRAQYAY